MDDSYQDDELEDLKTEAVFKFHELIKSCDDKFTLLVIKALIECILTQNDYNDHVVALFLYRRTKLSFNTILRRINMLKLRLRISRKEWFDKTFSEFNAIEPRPDLESNFNIITDWEKRAIFKFQNSNDRLKSKHFEKRYNRVSDKKSKIKSSQSERINWMLMYNGDDLEEDCYQRFNTGYSTFLKDKRKAFD